MSKYRNYCWTLNNFEDDHREAIKEAYRDKEFSYVIYGIETGASGTPHLQGYTELTGRKSMRQLKRLHRCPGLHIEHRMGTQQQAIDYCKKDDQITELGTQKSQGARRDLIEAKATITQHRRRQDLFLDDDLVCVMSKYGNWAEKVFTASRSRPQSTYEPQLPWQHALLNELLEPPSERSIIWIWSSTGAQGKSSTARHLLLDDDYSTLYTTGGKYVDLAYLFDYESIVVVNLARSTDISHVSYKFLEGLKDCILTSTKYQCCTKIFEPCHVIVFANEPPLHGALSVDRLDVRCVDPDAERLV